MVNCGEVNAEGVPGWNGLPSRSWEGRRGVKFISNAVPEFAMLSAVLAVAVVLMAGMFTRR